MATRAPTFRPEPATDDLDLRSSLRELGLRQREDFMATRRPMKAWALLVPEPQWGRLDFENFPYLEELYSDEVANAREVVIPKATQVGASTLMWRWAARQADQFGETVIYTFPTQDHVNDFGDERIEPAIEGSSYLLSRIPSHFVKHKRLKRIGRGWLHLRGAKSRAGAQAVAAQALVFDEYDEIEPRIMVQFERRLSGARAQGKVPRLRRIGIRTQPGYGMDAAWDESDQRVWHVTCPECELEQPITWEESVRWSMPDDDRVMRAGHDHFEDPKKVEEAWRACRECEASLEGEPLKRGRWVVTNPDSPVMGYFLQRLIVPHTDLEEIVKNSRKTQPHEVEAFYNNDLGLAFSPAESALDEASILAACSLGLPPEQVVQGYAGANMRTAGIDVASVRNLNIRISEQLPDGRRRALWIAECESFREAGRLLSNFGVALAVVDHLPERRAARTLAATFPGRVVLCAYDDRNESDAVRYNVEENLATVNRTEAIDAMMDSIRQLRNYPLQAPPPGYVEQLKAPRRRTVEKPSGKKQRVYVSVGADDYAHAEVYDLVATELLRLRVGVVAQQEAAVPRHVPDEELGFRRTQLERPVDEYQPGLGEEPTMDW